MNNLPTEEEYFAQYKTDGLSNKQAIFTCNCGGTVWKDLTMVLTTYPPQSRAECDKCGKVFFVKH